MGCDHAAFTPNDKGHIFFDENKSFDFVGGRYFLEEGNEVFKFHYCLYLGPNEQNTISTNNDPKVILNKFYPVLASIVYFFHGMGFLRCFLKGLREFT